MNSDHVRMSPKNQKFLCTHCGVYKPINPGLTSGLQDQIDAFKTTRLKRVRRDYRHHALTLELPVPVHAPLSVDLYRAAVTVVAHHGRFLAAERHAVARLEHRHRARGVSRRERVLQGFEQIGKEINGEKA